MSRLLRLFLISLFTLPVIAGPALLEGKKREAEEPIKFMDVFAIDGNPGKGSLAYKTGPNVENIELGPTTGLYGMGLIFHSSALPEAYRLDLKRTHILQIAFGTTASKVTTQIPQFGTVMLTTRKMPSKKKVFRTKMLGSKAEPGEDLALILFSSPQSPAERPDEEKLKNTYFAEKGLVTVTPLKTPQTIELKTQNGRMLFKTQTMKVEFNALLITPFNTAQGDLKGTVEIPVYWPYGKNAEAFSKKIAMETLGGVTTPIHIPEGIHHHNRGVAGSNKNSKNSSQDNSPE